MEAVMDYVRRNLRAAGPKRFAGIARVTGVAPSMLPKLMYRQRENPRIQTIQPLLDFFSAVERGEIDLPTPDLDPRYLPKNNAEKEAVHG